MIDHLNSFLKARSTGAGFSLIVTAALFLAAIPVQSQGKKQPASSPEQDHAIRVTSNLVSLDVLVKDKRGRAVIDLRPEELIVFENGVPQKIEFFD